MLYPRGAQGRPQASRLHLHLPPQQAELILQQGVEVVVVVVVLGVVPTVRGQRNDLLPLTTIILD